MIRSVRDWDWSGGGGGGGGGASREFFNGIQLCLEPLGFMRKATLNLLLTLIPM